MNSFYVILPSNTPVDGNRTSNYTVRLPNTLDLSEGDWTVALSSMIYPVSYHSDNIEEMWVIVEYYSALDNGQTENLLPSKIIIPNTIFKTVKHLEKTINDTLIGQTGIKRMRRDVVVEPFDIEPIGGKRRKNRPLTDIGLSRTPPILREDEPSGSGQTEKPPLADARIADARTTEEKALNSARLEVVDRSFMKMLHLVNITRGEIFDIEIIAAKVEDISEVTDRYLDHTNYEFDTSELEDIKKYLNDNKNKANELRDDAQAQRSKIGKYETEYGSAINDIEQKFIDKDLKNSKKIADRAKNIVIQFQALQQYLSGKKEEVNEMLKKIREIKFELNEGIEITEPGLKANIDRIRNTILSKFSPDHHINTEIYFYYDDNLGKFFLFNNQPKKVKNVRLSKHLAYLLGFEIEPADGRIKGIRMRRGGGFAKYTPDISGGIHQLYVYMPRIIDHTYLGNIQVPLLRIINVEKEPGHIAENIYTQEYHHKIIEKRISSIQIEIRSSTGELIKFNWGDVIVTLHFKRSLF